MSKIIMIIIQIAGMEMALYGSQTTTGTMHILFWLLFVVCLAGLYMAMSAGDEQENDKHLTNEKNKRERKEKG